MCFRDSLCCECENASFLFCRLSSLIFLFGRSRKPSARGHVRQSSALRCFGFGKANPWLGEPSALHCFGHAILRLALRSWVSYVSLRLPFVGPLTGAFGSSLFRFWESKPMVRRGFVFVISLRVFSRFTVL